jgi:SAM-dependent methyltransferase
MQGSIAALLRPLIPAVFRPRLRAIYEGISYFGLRYRSRLRAMYEWASYFGLRYRCPFCCARLRTFLPYGLAFPVLKEKKVVGGGYRQNALCPICGSLDRERLLYLYLLHKTDLFAKPKKLLHVAPEPRLADVLRATPSVDYLTADLVSKRAMVKMDITDIGFPEASFDVIICNHVLEHVLDDAEAMSELYRTLKPGGWAILQVPLSLSLTHTYEDPSITTTSGREEAFGQADHVRLYAADYQDRLVRAGFTVSIFSWITEAEHFGGRRNLFGLDENERMYVVRKHQ